FQRKTFVHDAISILEDDNKHVHQVIFNRNCAESLQTDTDSQQPVFLRRSTADNVNFLVKAEHQPMTTNESPLQPGLYRLSALATPVGNTRAFFPGIYYVRIKRELAVLLTNQDK